MIRLSETHPDEVTSLIDRVRQVENCNAVRLRLEKLLHENDFEVNLAEGNLDPRMANLFPNYEVNLMEQISMLLVDDPWTDSIDLLGPEVNFRNLHDATTALIKVEKLLAATSVAFNRISPEPSEEEVAWFRKEVEHKVSKQGSHWLFSDGSIAVATGEKKYRYIVRYLLHFPRSLFPSENGQNKRLRLPDLKTALYFRDRMQKIMKRTLEAHSEREEKRK